MCKSLSLTQDSSVSKLSGELVKLLGAKFDMDYETWTSRMHTSDREYFAAPLNERGACSTLFDSRSQFKSLRPAVFLPFPPILRGFLSNIAQYTT
jgi:hypothetical protein